MGALCYAEELEQQEQAAGRAAPTRRNHQRARERRAPSCRHAPERVAEADHGAALHLHERRRSQRRCIGRRVRWRRSRFGLLRVLADGAAF
jgi:hypothetical protein